jgi:hypothetical protein
MEYQNHKALTYVEYRAVSGVFQNIDTRRAERGWGVNILEDARHWIGLLQYNLSTTRTQKPGSTPKLPDPGYWLVTLTSKDVRTEAHT